MGFDGGIGGGSHGRAHVVCILDAKVGNGADGTAGDSGAMAVTAHKCSPGTGNRPLGGGSPLPAVTQGKAVLPLGGGKVGRGHGHRVVRKAAANRHGGQQQTFRHGGTGAVQPKVGNSQIAQGEGRADALVQKVAGENKVEVLQLHVCLFGQLPESQLLHLLFALFPCFLPEIGILRFDVEGMGKRAFGLLFPGHACPVGNDRWIRQNEALPSPLLICHKNTCFSFFCGIEVLLVCAGLAFVIQFDKKPRRQKSDVWEIIAEDVTPFAGHRSSAVPSNRW